MPEIEADRRGNILGRHKNTRNKKITLRGLTRKNVEKSVRIKRWPMADHQAQGRKRSLENKRTWRTQDRGVTEINN